MSPLQLLKMKRHYSTLQLYPSMMISLYLLKMKQQYNPLQLLVTCVSTDDPTTKSNDEVTVAEDEEAHSAKDPVNTDEDLIELLYSEDMSEAEKQRRTTEHSSSIEYNYRAHEQISTQKYADTKISSEVAHAHLQKAQYMVQPELLAYFKAYAIMIKSLHLAHTSTEEEVFSIKISVELAQTKQQLEFKRIVKPNKERQTSLEKCYDTTFDQLKRVQNTLNLLVYLLLGDDAKKGKIITQPKSRQEVSLPNDDDAADGGSKGGGKSVSRSYMGGNQIGSSGTSDKSTIQTQRSRREKYMKKRIQDWTWNRSDRWKKNICCKTNQILMMFKYLRTQRFKEKNIVIKEV